MGVIDDEGRLFGVVNVVDALVVLVVLATVLAGVAVVDPFGGGSDSDDGSPTATRYVTVDLGKLSASTASRITAGDRVSVNGSNGRYEVSDVYVAPAPKDRVTVLVRVGLDGTLGGEENDTFLFGGSPVEPGRPMTLGTPNYSVGGTVEAVGEARQLDTRNRSLVVETKLPAGTAGAIAPGDEYRVAGETVATVETVFRYPTSNLTTERVQVGLSVRTLRTVGGYEFAGDRVAVGRKLTVVAGDYSFRGTVIRQGSTAPPGNDSRTTAVVKLANVSPDLVDDLRVGLAETRNGRELARVTDLRVEPATVLVTDAEGNVYARDHPTERDVYLTVELGTRSTDTGPTFHGLPLRSSRTVTLDFGSVAVTGRVVDLGESTSRRTRPASAPVPRRGEWWPCRC